MNIKYLAGACIALPLLPLMYYQGKRIRASVPRLPEAQGSHGKSGSEESHGNTLTVLAIGESTIAGVGVRTHAEGFAGTFARELSGLFNSEVSWKVYARSGYTANRVTTKIIPNITEDHADLIVIGLGGNDAFTLNRPSKWKADVRALIASIQSKFPGALVIFCNMPPIKEFPAFTPLIRFTVGNLVEILGEELQNVDKEFKDVHYFGERITLENWIERYEITAKKEDFFSDGVHPSKLTYQTWAKDIAQQVFMKEEVRHTLQRGLSS
jgi:lysophospholipase L1-like esterase